MVKIEVKNQQKKIRVAPPQIKTIVRTILRHEKVNNAELSICFVTDGQIQSLNKAYLNRNHVTDVLAFDLGDTPFLKQKKGNAVLEGEVIISAPRAFAQAKMYESSIQHELQLYIIHGILHLMGFDDHQLRDKKKMREKEKELLHLIKNKPLS